MNCEKSWRELIIIKQQEETHSQPYSTGRQLLHLASGMLPWDLGLGAETHRQEGDTCNKLVDVKIPRMWSGAGQD